jgi:hypothetical protein
MRQSKLWCVLVTTVLLVGFTARGADDQDSDIKGVDVLVPQAGHQLFGTFKRATDKEIVFTLDSGTAVTFSWDQVKELQIRHRTTLLAKKPLAPTSPSKSSELDSLTIQQDQGNLIILSTNPNLSIPKVNLISISSTSPSPPSVAWTISITPKASLTSGTQTQQTWGAQVLVRREQYQSRTDWHHQMTTLILDGNNSLTEQTGTPSIRTHEYDGMFNHAVYLWHGLYTNGVAEGYHNSSLNLYLEQSYGGGLGGRVFNNERNTLELTGDFLYIAEHFYGTVPSVSFAGARLAERYTIKLADLQGGPLEVIESGSYTPAFNQKKAWQSRGTVTLSVPISKALSTNLNFSDNYLENAPNARKNYSTSSIGLTYTFPTPK